MKCNKSNRTPCKLLVVRSPIAEKQKDIHSILCLYAGPICKQYSHQKIEFFGPPEKWGYEKNPFSACTLACTVYDCTYTDCSVKNSSSLYLGFNSGLAFKSPKIPRYVAFCIFYYLIIIKRLQAWVKNFLYGKDKSCQAL